MGIRFILLAATLGLLFYVMRQLLNRRKKANNTQQEQYVDTVACAQCGEHLPQDQAIYRNNHYYCCEEHATTVDKG
jgi:uncharacterized protein